jgi:hypothetical protein
MKNKFFICLVLIFILIINRAYVVAYLLQVRYATGRACGNKIEFFIVWIAHVEGPEELKLDGIPSSLTKIILALSHHLRD